MGKFEDLLKSAHDFKYNTVYWDHSPLAPHENYIRNYPAPWLSKTCELLRIIEGTTVVEIGSTRSETTAGCLNYYDNCFKIETKDAPPCCQDGHSTHFFAKEGFDVYTVDIDERCKSVLESQYIHHIKTDFPSNIHVNIPMDGIEFLKNFDGKIDLLYLDGWDVGVNQYAEKHLEAFKAAEDKLADLHLISIDDTDFNTEAGGKDKLLTPYLLDNGYVKILWGRQIVFVKIPKRDV